MGYTTEHRGRRPNVVVPYTEQLLNTTCIGANQSSEGIRYSGVLAERFRCNVVIQEPLGSRKLERIKSIRLTRRH